MHDVGRNRAPWGAAWAYRDLVRHLVGRDLRHKYKGSTFGFAWSLANPLLMAAIYTLAFEYIVRVPVPRFPLYLLSGLLPWTFFAGGLLAATSSIVDGAPLVRKVAFPRLVLPLSAVADPVRPVRPDVRRRRAARRAVDRRHQPDDAGRRPGHAAAARLHRRPRPAARHRLRPRPRHPAPRRGRGAALVLADADRLRAGDDSRTRRGRAHPEPDGPLRRHLPCRLPRGHAGARRSTGSARASPRPSRSRWAASSSRRGRPASPRSCDAPAERRSGLGRSQPRPLRRSRSRRPPGGRSRSRRRGSSAAAR